MREPCGPNHPAGRAALGLGPGSVCSEPVQGVWRCQLRMGTRYPPAALTPGLGTEGETQASAEQGAQLGAQPGISSRFERRTETRPGQCHTAAGRSHLPFLPEAIVGAPGSLWPGWVGLEEASPTPDCSPLRLHLLGLLWKEMSPTRGACLSAPAWASGFEHRYWPRQADGRLVRG